MYPLYLGPYQPPEEDLQLLLVTPYFSNGTLEEYLAREDTVVTLQMALKWTTQIFTGNNSW
jgi:hypothetical protein